MVVNEFFQGNFNKFFLQCNNSNTAPYLRYDSNWEIKKSFKPIDSKRVLKIENANLHNLRNVSVEIPLGLMVGIAGVSGSGKSSLIADTLVPKLKEIINHSTKHVTDKEANDPTYEIDKVTISSTAHIKKVYCYGPKAHR